MDHQPKEVRQAATQAFQESLDQLQETLKPAEVAAPAAQNSQAKLQPESKDGFVFDLATFEQAVADIEEFLEQKQAEQPGE